MAYRALEHGRARSACLQGMREFPAEIRDFAEAFIVLQIERQKADYALDTPTYQKSDVWDHIASAEQAPVRADRRRGQARFCRACAIQATVTIRRSDMNNQQVREIAEGGLQGALQRHRNRRHQRRARLRPLR